MTDASAPDERHERVYRLFQAACELPAAERAAFVERECRDEAERRELTALLEFDRARPGTAGVERLRVKVRVPDEA
ncbi:MAG: hypothetical protein NTV21_00145, partial [Planctomycetota bacterium]|nr:hypothetical protein [Planctomycetota bacterium]